MGSDVNKGYIFLHRKIMDWDWWSDQKTMRLWITIMLLANYEDKKWRGIEVKRGQLLTSLKSLSEKSGLSVQSVRTSLNRLKSTGEITCESTSKNTLITVENYDKYQIRKSEDNKETNTDTNNRLTNVQQAPNKQVTTTNTLNKLNTLNTLNNYYHIPLDDDDEIPGLEDVFA